VGRRSKRKEGWGGGEREKGGRGGRGDKGAKITLKSGFGEDISRGRMYLFESTSHRGGDGRGGKHILLDVEGAT